MFERIEMEGSMMNYYVEIHKVGIRTYSCTFNQMLAELALECIKLSRTIRADILDSDHNIYYVTCRYLKETGNIDLQVKEL